MVLTLVTISGTGGGGSGGSTAKYTETRNIVSGLNTVTHNLNLTNPKSIVINIMSSTGSTIFGQYSNYTANSVDLYITGTHPNAQITII